MIAINAATRDRSELAEHAKNVDHRGFSMRDGRAPRIYDHSSEVGEARVTNNINTRHAEIELVLTLSSATRLY